MPPKIGSATRVIANASQPTRSSEDIGRLHDGR